MAKELPYFKFEPNAWENGNIQMLSREDKGLFIDICSMYWSRLGELPEKLVIQKLCGGNANALNLLCEENIIELIEGNIYIKFLTIQLSEFENKSDQNSKNAKEGWEKRRKQKDQSKRNANALNPQSETDAIREEEIRGDEMKEDLPPSAKEKSFKNLSETEFYQTIKEFSEKYPSKMLREFFDYWREPMSNKKMRMTGEKAWDLSRRLSTWNNRNSNKNSNGNNTINPTNTDGTRNLALARRR